MCNVMVGMGFGGEGKCVKARGCGPGGAVVRKGVGVWNACFLMTREVRFIMNGMHIYQALRYLFKACYPEVSFYVLSRFLGVVYVLNIGS